MNPNLRRSIFEDPVMRKPAPFDAPAYHIRSLAKALRILERLGDGPAKPQVLARELSLGITTTYRILSTLKSSGFVRQESSDGRFGLGFKFLELSNRLRAQLPLITIGSRYMAELHSLYDETVNLAILEKTEVFYVNVRESSKPLRIGARLGDRRPANCTALGKVLLSDLSRRDLLQLYEQGRGLVRSTPRSIADLGALERELEAVRASGVATDQEEATPGICCVACPVRDLTGRTVAAMSIAVPTNRSEPERLVKFAGSLKAAAERFSQDLGFYGKEVKERKLSG